MSQSHDPSSFQAFLSQVKQILENFYNFPYLNTHPTARGCQAPRQKPSETDGQRLRRIFIESIEQLDDTAEGTQKSLLTRQKSLLRLRYLESAPMHQIAHDLGVSERQAYRDLKKAEETLAALLLERLGEPPPPTETTAEVESLDLHYHLVNAAELAQNATRAVERLAQQLGVQLSLNLPPEPPILFTDSRLAQQILTALLSHILQTAGPGTVSLNLEAPSAQVNFTFQAQGCANLTSLDFSNPVALNFIHQLGWTLRADSTPQAPCFRLVVGKPRTLVMVIDDHPPLIELIRRYLTPTHCQIIGVNDGLQALELARWLQPDAILLDVMMPHIDGWEVLQRLNNFPGLETIPVIICSIFNDPKLAFSLGAAAVLNKPVKREELMHTLRQLNILK